MENNKVDIFMTIYWSDWMRDTSHLSLQEQGAYLMVVRCYWNNQGPLDDDKTRLYRSSGAQSRSEKESVNLVLETYFLHENGKYHHKRIDSELVKAIDNKKKKVDRAKKAAAAKHGAASSAPSTAQAGDKQCPSPSTSYLFSDTNVSDETPPPIDFKKIIFGEGLKYLSNATGKKESQLRSLMGKWCKAGDGRVADAIIRAEKEKAVDPIAFIQAILYKGADNGKHTGIDKKDWHSGTDGFGVVR